MSNSSFFPHTLRRPSAKVRLFCFPYAGANAAYYRSWGPILPDEIELWPVELPGRGTRFSEPAQDCMSSLARDVAAVIAQHAEIPFALFGHSMGSAIAFATSENLLSRHGIKPAAVFASGRAAPHKVRKRSIHLLSDEGIREEIQRLGGTPPEIMGNEELMTLVLPVIRNDYRLIETYEPETDCKIQSPVHVLCGRDDVDAPLQDLKAWQELTSESCDVTLFDGDHFYLNGELQKVVSRVVGQLDAILRRSTINKPSELTVLT